MSKKENNNATMIPGEIGMIRDILMGPQMVKIEERFETLNAKFQQLEEQLEKKGQELEQKANQLRSLEKEIDTQLAALEKRLETNVEKLEGMIQKTDTNSKAKLGKMLSDIGQKLMDNR